MLANPTQTSGHGSFTNNIRMRWPLLATSCCSFKWHAKSCVKPTFGLGFSDITPQYGSERAHLLEITPRGNQSDPRIAKRELRGERLVESVESYRNAYRLRRVRPAGGAKQYSDGRSITTMSGPIVRKYGFPNFDKIFGERPLEHGVEEGDETADQPAEAEASAAASPKKASTKKKSPKSKKE
jgi:hypothetical protein